MSLTVGELVAYIKVDDQDSARKLDGVASTLDARDPDAGVRQHTREQAHAAVEIEGSLPRRRGQTVHHRGGQHLGRPRVHLPEATR